MYCSEGGEGVCVCWGGGRISINSPELFNSVTEGYDFSQAHKCTVVRVCWGTEGGINKINSSELFSPVAEGNDFSRAHKCAAHSEGVWGREEEGEGDIYKYSPELFNDFSGAHKINVL